VSTPETSGPVEREPASQAVAGFLAALAIFAGLVAIVYYPGRIGPGAILVALLAAALGGFQHRLAAAAIVITGVSWFAGMVIAVLLEQPIF
jgi:hypothetical protein